MKWLQQWRDRPYWALAIVTLLFLCPFLGKPFNMDDPLFIWTARQIHNHPGDPFGFIVNWYGTASPMWEVTQNPPLASYYLALAGAIAGWSEVALRAAMLLPALAAVLGTYRLARRFCERPLLAALLTLFSPVFLVSNMTVMCDGLMLAFWIWAVIFWVEGIEDGRASALAASGVLMALAAVTKYFGVCLIPLLALYAVIAKSLLRRWAFFLLIPLLALAAWQWTARLLYGHEFLFTAANYAGRLSGFLGGAPVRAVLIGLSFVGGGMAVMVFLMPFIWPARVWIYAFIAAALLSMALAQQYSWIEGATRASMQFQTAAWAAGGILLLALVFAGWRTTRDAGSCLLTIWILATFAFAAIFNWTINGRSILPMTPAVAILVARRLQGRRVTIPVCAGAVLALLVARSDYLLARAVRCAAGKTYERFHRDNHTIWFQGHWGFQYYLAELGGQPLDSNQSKPRPGDRLAVPLNNTNQRYPNSPHDKVGCEASRFLTTMNLYVGGGFYTSQGGPLPFVFGVIPPEEVLVFK